MSLQTMPVTIHLPNALYRRFQQAAQATQRRVEDVLLQTLAGNIPPALDEAPLDLRPELEAMQSLDTDTLWIIARSQITPEQQARHEQLLHLNQRGAIKPAERVELDRLGAAADKLTAKKAYAYALLRWRGFPLLTLDAMERQL